MGDFHLLGSWQLGVGGVSPWPLGAIDPPLVAVVEGGVVWFPLFAADSRERVSHWLLGRRHDNRIPSGRLLSFPYTCYKEWTPPPLIQDKARWRVRCHDDPVPLGG